MVKYTAAQKRAYAKRMKGRKKKIQKKPLLKARKKIVEIKKRDAYKIAVMNKNPDNTAGNHYPFNATGINQIVNNDAIYIFQLDAWARQSHGFEGHNCVGDSIFMRWLDFRLQCQFPTGTDVIVKPVKIYLVHGWIKTPVAATEHTVPTRANLTQTNIRNFHYAQLQEYFDNKRDWLVPKDMASSNIKIQGYKQLQPNRNGAIGATNTGFPSLPSINRRLKWTINRKVQLVEGTAELTDFPSAAHDTQNLYANNSWTPFVCLYNPNFENMRNSAGADVRMTVNYNSTLYFSDS